ncbi:MAG TPA: rhomboid family intramembrane serine protease [Verrucomicrobiae bacterium]|nr:rhomboid family intramembrane serine protease [Verrucomicrobiae bacterium]
MTARIPARSRRQAMDWGLALASQGIQPTIDRSDEMGWGLIVEEPEHAPALAVIELYRAENLHWPWRRKVFHREVLFDWSSIAWVFLICIFYWLTTRIPSLADAGVMDGTAVSRGEWWRLFTAIFLHADLAHLASNAGIGLILIGLTMGAYGTGVGLLAALLAGAGGNLITWLIDSTHLSLGASGMVMGALGLLAAQSVVMWRNRRALKFVLSGIVAGAMLLVLLGTSPNSDVIAHFGGFGCGVLLGTVLVLARRYTRTKVINILCGAAFCLLVIVTWWLAISK